MSTQTLVTCYQQPDDDTLRRVLDEPRKLRDRGLGDDTHWRWWPHRQRGRNGARNDTSHSSDENQPRSQVVARRVVR
jgi:hypothetical protein